MRIAVDAIPIVLYGVVAAISWIMAWKSLSYGRFLPFHEKAAGKSLDQLDEGVQTVILALMRTVGLGFLTVGALLTTVSVVECFKPRTLFGIGILTVCGIYCFGLFLVNVRLHKTSGVETPWKGSLIAAAMILGGIIISLF
jgi:hypothetical protein